MDTHCYSTVKQEGKTRKLKMKTNQPLGGGLRPAESTEQAATALLVMIRLEQADIHHSAHRQAL